MKLDPEQRQAVHADDGALLILAGPGAGKTAVLTHRVAALIERGVPPAEIVLLTFTQKAAREMASRVHDLVGPAALQIWSGTFHAIALRILREFAPRLGYGPHFGVLTPSDAKDILHATITEHLEPYVPQLPSPQHLLDVVSYMTNANVDLRTAWAARHRETVPDWELVEVALSAYALGKMAHNVMDYDDLLANLYVLLLEHHDVRSALAHRFRHVLVDEYQDTNPVQAALAALFAEAHRNITVVGDDNQSIYGFRGADIGNIIGFPERFPDARVLTLTQNYRATPELVAVANDGIGHNPQPFPRTLQSARSAGPKPTWISVADAAAQGHWIVDQVRTHQAAGTPLSRQAVLFRANAQGDAVMAILRDAGLPVDRRLSLRLIDRAHIRDLLALFAVLQNPENRVAWRRLLMLVPGVGEATAESLLEALMADGDPWDCLVQTATPIPLSGRVRQSFGDLRSLLLDLRRHGFGNPAWLDRLFAIGYVERLRSQYGDGAEQRISELRALVETAQNHGDPGTFFQSLSLGDPGPSEASSGLVLSTIHQAKGLEWDVVYVIGLTEGSFPMGAAFSTPAAMTEERRLFYVASTRARKWLHWISPTAPRGGARGLPHPVSRFVAELDPALYTRLPS